MSIIPTPAQVKDVTGVDVTAEQVATAASVVELTTGVDLSLDPSPYSRADRRRLTAGIAWQARYVAEHPDALSREAGLTSASANGVALSWGPEGSGGSLLGPLASLALKRLSWRRSRTVRLVEGRPTPSMAKVPPQTLTDDGLDSSWRPL